MTKVFETQTILVDPNGPPVTNVNLDKDFIVTNVSIITNTVKANGVREITLGIIYEDTSSNQRSISLETILVGNNINDVTDVTLADVQTINQTLFIDHTIKDDTISVTILTISTVGAKTNQFTTRKFQFDPSNQIITGIPVVTAADVADSHLVNVGSLVKTDSVNSGTMNAVALFVYTLP